jgi:molybdopterin synthase catalytic subunit
MVVRIQTEQFDQGKELNTFAGNQTDAGAVVSFTGVVRDDTGDLQALEIEHYPAMTESAIAAMAEGLEH